jgi:hypothetical protein
MIKEPNEQLGHIPKADDLYAVRDMLYILLQNGGSITKKQLYNLINQEFLTRGCDIWAEATFEEYVTFIDYLEFAKFTPLEIKLLKPVEDFLVNNYWERGTVQLSQKEKEFFREKLLKYRALLRFLEVVFIEIGSLEADIDQLSLNKIILISESVKGRKVLLEKWMKYCGVTDDRDSRAMLSWCLQTDIVDKDEYSDSYFLISCKEPDINTFKQSLIRNYPLVFDRMLKRAKIPDLRVKVCADLHMAISNFDKLLGTLENQKPHAIFMDRATNVRDEVAKYALKRKSFYYYYIQIDVGCLSRD